MGRSGNKPKADVRLQNHQFRTRQGHRTASFKGSAVGMCGSALITLNVIVALAQKRNLTPPIFC